MFSSVSICNWCCRTNECFLNTYDTGRIEDEKIADAVKKLFKLTPQGIVTSLDLLRPIYKILQPTVTLVVMVSLGKS